MSTSIFKEQEILKLCATDAKIIEKSFKISDSLGNEAIENSIVEFKHILKGRKGNIYFPMDLDYRVYIVNLLTLTMDAVENNNKAQVFQKIVFS